MIEFELIDGSKISIAFTHVMAVEETDPGALFHVVAAQYRYPISPVTAKNVLSDMQLYINRSLPS